MRAFSQKNSKFPLRQSGLSNSFIVKVKNCPAELKNLNISDLRRLPRCPGRNSMVLHLVSQAFLCHFEHGGTKVAGRLSMLHFVRRFCSTCNILRGWTHNCCLYVFRINYDLIYEIECVVYAVGKWTCPNHAIFEVGFFVQKNVWVNAIYVFLVCFNLSL